MIIDAQESLYKVGNKTFHCGTHVTMELIGGKWKCIILWYLRHGETRFSALKKYMPDITEKMLSIQLQALENNRFISKKVIGEKPPLKVYYQLTSLGRSLLPIIELITNWGDNYGKTNGRLIKPKV
jgi:DNA-binding HxlR family transcriptional regulator